MEHKNVISEVIKEGDMVWVPMERFVIQSRKWEDEGT